MKRIFLFLFLAIISLVSVSAQEEDLHNLFLKFSDLYTAGDFIGAENCMLQVIYDKDTTPKSYLFSAYNNIGLVKKSMGLYDEALQFFTKVEEQSATDNYSLTILAYVYTNMSRIYTFNRSHETAILLLEKALRIFSELMDRGYPLSASQSTSYLNLGIVYYESGDYQKALETLDESLQIKLKYNLPETELVYLSLAKTHANMGDIERAGDLFKKSISTMMKQYGDNYYRLAEIYFDYGLFLRLSGDIEGSLLINRRALTLCKSNYGEKHPYVSLAFRSLGDHYKDICNYDSSLYYYQKALTAISKGFREMDFMKNPSIDSSLVNVDLLKTLRKKSGLLEIMADNEPDDTTKIKIIKSALSTIELAVDLIDRIRSGYLTEESRIYLAENEKETYISAIRTAEKLYILTGDRAYISRMYSSAAGAKSAVLRSAIRENEILGSSALPDSLGRRRGELAANIAAYNNVLQEELQKTQPDSSKLAFWKDEIFKMNREWDRLSGLINEQFPQISELSEKIGVIPLSVIQKELKKNQSVLDYIISNEYENGTRSLYCFIISKNGIDCFRASPDSMFAVNAEIIRQHSDEKTNNDFGEYTAALYYMYNLLIRPSEPYLTGNRVIIIPDEETAWLPFEALIMRLPDDNRHGYEGLQYLINDYSFSYGHSASLVSGRKQGKKASGLYSFAPDYGQGLMNTSEHAILKGAGREIRSALRYFRGKAFTGNQATENNFRLAAGENKLFHLAMHSVTDSLDSRYSWLAFDPLNDTIHDGRLYNYEMSLMKISSPMVMLSACNSGSGTLYHGEGLMSMARSLVLAGASAVVRTSWEVNDETSAEIVSGFYKYLARGLTKDEALQKAKIDFMKNSIPLLSDPCYWAGYEVTGNTAPIMSDKKILVICLLILSAAAAGALIYLRRRRIFAEASE